MVLVLIVVSVVVLVVFASTMVVSLLLLFYSVTVVVDLATFWVDERSQIVYDHRMTPATSRPTSTVSLYFSISSIGITNCILLQAGLFPL